jgi:hypothetical protein
MVRRVALVRTDVSEELTRATRRNIPEDAIFHDLTYWLLDSSLDRGFCVIDCIYSTISVYGVNRIPHAV